MDRTRNRRISGRIARACVSAFAAFSFFAVALSLYVRPADAAPTELDAKVVWTRGDRVYIASAESLALDEGDLLTFRSGNRELAKGAVVDVRDAAMAVARVTSGSLRTEKKLEKIRILVEPAPLRPLAVLRVGCPSPSRPSLLFRCDNGTVGASLPVFAYRADTLSERSYRFVREDAVLVDAPWPDTLLVRMFDEAADEEIALERGELDIAVFWPGELSTHIRDDPRWAGHLHGRWSGQIVAWAWEKGSAARLSAYEARHTFESLNRLVFRGDLPPYSGVVDKSAPGDTLGAGRAANGARFEVDAALPGSREIKRALEQAPKSAPSSPSRRVIFIGYEPMKGQMASGEGAAPDSTPTVSTVLSAITCPVVSSPRLRSTIGALGPNAFADLLGCALPRRNPR